MKVSLYKILAVKTALQSLNLLSIPIIEDNDLDSIISVFVVGLADRPQEFRDLITAISGESKFWEDELEEAIEVLRNFFTLIPRELKVLTEQLKSVSSTLENAVLQMMKENMIQESLDTQESEQKQTT